MRNLLEQQLNQEYMQAFTVTKETCLQDLQRIVDLLDGYCKQYVVVSVYGREKYRELCGRFQDYQLPYDLHHSRFGVRNNYSKTNVDATFVHMEDDHMKNAWLKLGNNIQIDVDSKYIVAADIYQDRNDVWTLVPFLKHMEENLQFRYPSVTADSGYESEEGYNYLGEMGQAPYIKPQTYETWKRRSYISKQENTGYEVSIDCYTCHAGKRLEAVGKKKQKSKNSCESEVIVYECRSLQKTICIQKLYGKASGVLREHTE